MPGQLQNWTFGLIVDSDPEVTVTPKWEGEADLVFKDQRPKGQIFTRKELDTALIFTGDDYDTLHALLSSCNELTLIIYYKSVEKWRGISRGLDEWNWKNDICQVIPSFSPVDDYTCVFEELKKEENIFFIPAAPETSVDIISGTITSCTVVITLVVSPDNGEPGCNLTGANITNNCVGGLGCQDMTLTRLQVVADGMGTWTYTATFSREELVVACDGGVGGTPPTLDNSWTLYLDDCAGSGNATFTRPVIRTLNEAASTNIQGGAKDIIYNILGQDITNTIPNGRKLNDLLDYFFGKCSLTVESQALNLNVTYSPPSNTFYDWSNPVLHNILLFQKSDVKNPTATEQATKETITLEYLLNWLRDTLQIYWVVNGSTVTIEHVSNIKGANGEDLTSTVPDLVRYRNNFNVSSGNMPRFERFSWEDEISDIDFEGLPIEYDCYNEDDDDKTTVSKSVTFLSDVLGFPEKYSNNGYVVVSTIDISGTLYVTRATGVLSNDVRLNGSFAWSNIHPKAWIWERYQPTGLVNNSPVTFQTSIKKRQQQDIIIFKNPDDYFLIDFMDLINTELGWGEVSQALYSAASCELTLKLLQ